MDEWKDIRRVARAITLAEVKKDYQSILDSLQYGNGNSNNAPSQSKVGELDTPPLKDRRSGTVLGITGTGGAGKSSVTDEIVRRYLNSFTDKTIAVVSVDPSKRKREELCWVIAFA